MTLPYFPGWSLTVEESEGGKAALGSHTGAQICCASVSLSAARVLCLPDPHSLPDSRDTPIPREQPGPGKRVPGLGPGSATDPWSSLGQPSCPRDSHPFIPDPMASHHRGSRSFRCWDQAPHLSHCPPPASPLRLLRKPRRPSGPRALPYAVPSQRTPSLAPDLTTQALSACHGPGPHQTPVPPSPGLR